MVFQWFKNKYKQKATGNHFQHRLLILPVLQIDQQLDFICKVERQVVLYLFDLSLMLKPQEIVEKVEFKVGDSSLQLKDFIYNQTQFIVKIEGGWDNCKSTILFEVETNTKQRYSFTTLVSIISHYKNQHDIDNGQRSCRLWTLDRNPEIGYTLENQDPWIEGDMILNIRNHYLWEYKRVDNQVAWLPLFIMEGAVEPVSVVYSDAQNPGERLILNQIHSDQGKIKSNSKGSLSVKGDITTDSIYTKAIVAGHPLGEGMLFTSPGMMAGHSLYIGSPEAKPKNIYLGIPGVISTKLISADYLQLTPLSIKDLPTHVTKGTLTLCYDYTGYSDLVLLYAMKDNPQIFTDWKPLFSSTISEIKERPPRPTSRPHLYPVSFNPNIQTKNIVEMKPAVVSHISSKVSPPEDKHVGVDTYTRFQFEREKIPASIDKKITWKKLCIGEAKQQIKGEGQRYWSDKDHCWEAPVNGLLHIEGWLTFSEEPSSPSEPISYHAGDMFLLNLACNQEQKIDIYPTTQLEFPLFPYVNDVTHQVCANQQISFTATYPVQKGEKITFLMAYMHQPSAYGQASGLPIKKAVITVFMS